MTNRMGVLIRKIQALFVSKFLEVKMNLNDTNKLVFDGEYVHYSIPVPPIPRVCTTYALVRHFWKACEFVHFVTHVLPDHVNRPMDITVIPKKFDPKAMEDKYE